MAINGFNTLSISTRSLYRIVLWRNRFSTTNTQCKFSILYEVANGSLILFLNPSVPSILPASVRNYRKVCWAQCSASESSTKTNFMRITNWWIKRRVRFHSVKPSALKGKNPKKTSVDEYHFYSFHFSTFCRHSDPKIPQTAKNSLVSDVTSGQFVSDSLAEFLRFMETSKPIQDSELPDTVTYDLFNLRQTKRQPGLRAFDDMQLFSLAYMQRFCSNTNAYYKNYKAFVEMEIPARQG